MISPTTKRTTATVAGMIGRANVRFNNRGYTWVIFASGSWLCSASLGFSHRYDRSGVSVIDNKNEKTTAAVSVIVKLVKNCPATPERRPSGTNTTTVVAVEDSTGTVSSDSACAQASCGGNPLRSW